MDDLTKKNLKNYGMFFGIVILMTAILIFSIFGSRNSWKKGLAIEMQSVFDKTDSEAYIVDKYIDVNSIISTSSAVYSLLKVNSNQAENYYGIIVRVPSIVGPVPAVFMFSDKDVRKIEFVGYVGDYGIAEDTIDIKISNGIMGYWQKLIPNIIEKAKLERK